jgi:hypothetical protein
MNNTGLAGWNNQHQQRCIFVGLNSSSMLSKFLGKFQQHLVLILEKFQQHLVLFL